MKLSSLSFTERQDLFELVSLNTDGRLVCTGDPSLTLIIMSPDKCEVESFSLYFEIQRCTGDSCFRAQLAKRPPAAMTQRS